MGIGIGIGQIAESQYGHAVPARYLPILREHDRDVTDAGAFAVAIYRVQRCIYEQYFSNGGDTSDTFLRVLSSIQRQYCACELFYSAEIGKNFLLVHTLAVVIGPRSRVGDNCTVYQGVTIGTKYDTSRDFPALGSDVVVYAGAKIVGGISVGSGAVIAANAVVVKDVPAFTVVAGIPARPIGTAREGKYKLPASQK